MNMRPKTALSVLKGGIMEEPGHVKLGSCVEQDLGRSPRGFA